MTTLRSLMAPKRTIVMGAAGRDFHNFNVCFRDNADYEVVAFTATQIPEIAGRVYPASLAGSRYPSGIPIYPEEQLQELIQAHGVDEVIFAYSDVSHEHVMHRASVALAAGADFRLIGPRGTQLKSTRPVVSVCAVRTGAGKSPVTRHVAACLRKLGLRVVPVRHPMPYGDLAKQSVQRFATFADLDQQRCTVEEREEYEPLLEAGMVVFAGIDYERILRAAEQEADIILWDGGNNDLSFFVSDFHIVVVDALRPGHENMYHPGEANARMAEAFVINKVDAAPAENVSVIRQNLHALNPRAIVIEAASPIRLDDPAAVRGRRVLVIEDGPTLTHGGMAFGAGWLAARQFGAAEIVDPRPFAAGTIAETYRTFPHLGPVLPAMGYGPGMIREFEETINRTDADVVIVGTPIDVGRFLRINKPLQRARYDVHVIETPSLEDLLRRRFYDAVG